MKKFFKNNKDEIIDFIILICLLVYSYFTAFVLTAGSPTATKIHFYTIVHNIPVSIQTITFITMVLLSLGVYYCMNNLSKKIKEYSRY